MTYTLYQAGGEIYPRDSTIEFTFNQFVASGCLSGDASSGDAVMSAANFITIQNLPEDQTSSRYFKNPQVIDKKIVFRADTSNGYIPVATNAQRSISIRIPKENVWYVNTQYTEPVKIYLDSDIRENYLINSATSSKTVFKYNIPQKNEQPIGTLKVDGEDVGSNKYSYSVGQTVSLRYKIETGYTFKGWKFVNEKGETLSRDNLKLSVSEEEIVNNTAQINITIDNYMEDIITVTPELFDPVNIQFVRNNAGIAAFKADNINLTQENQTIRYSVGSSFVLSCKLADNYTFYGWEFKKTFTKEDGSIVTEILSDEDLEELGIETDLEEGSDNGFDKISRLAQVTVTLKDYTDKQIIVTPICFENLSVTSFNLNNTETTYQRDSDIEFTFNKAIIANCKDKAIIKISGW